MKKQLLLLVMMLLPMVASAYDFELDGFYYNVISVSDLTLELTTDVEIKDQLNDTDNNKKYSGDVVIPETVNYKGKEWKITKISYTFKFCYDVTSVTIPSSVSEIGECSFIGCSSLKEINISGGIKRIGMWAFFRCGLEKLIIPNNITYVDQCAFQDCNSLKEVIIEEGDEPIYFKGGNWSFGVFADCSALEKAEINREYTFYDFRNEIVTPPFRRCLSLKTAIFGDKITSVPKFSFEGCTSLTDVEMSNNILSIEQSAFSGCISLETLNLPSSVTTIADNVFKNCTSLYSTLIRNGMTSIGASAFEGCTSINSVDIVKTINNIGANAFNGCTNIKDIYVHNNVPISSVEESSFSGSSYLDAILHVPTGYIETYNNAPVWKLFFNIQEKKYGYNLIYIVDGEEYKKYDIEEGESITPEAEPTKEGYTFSGWSEIPETMPAKDVTVTGTFTINKYKLTYTVDGTEYKTYEVEYGATITPEAAPTKEGYTFSGWSEIPETMPAKDVTVTGTFSINKYKLTYLIDGEEYKSYEVEYGATITPEPAPTKEGYEFSGWSPIPATMPAENLTITGTFTQILPYDEIKITSAGQTTWCSKYDLDFTEEEGLKVYTATGYKRSTGTIWLSRAKEVPAGEGILIMGDEGVYKIPHRTTTAYYANLMVGTVVAMTLNETDGEYTNYYLSNGKEGVGFYKVNGSVKLGANRAYLPLKKGTSGNAKTRYIGLSFDDGTTDLRESMNNGSDEPDVYYNLQGQRVDNPTKGLYIKNGRKVVIK